MFSAFLAAAASASALPKATAVDVASWFSADDYPAEAQQKGVQGDVVFEVDVDAGGKPTACRIAHSSGSPILDKTTCDIVLAKAKFKPAMRRRVAVAGRYSSKASWRLQDSVGNPNGYLAAVLDYSKDAEHPTCTVVNRGLPAAGACEQALQKFGPMGTQAKASKLVTMMSFSNGDQQPYSGDPAWGRRVSFVAVDLYSPKAGGKPACAVVASEGQARDANPCSKFADATTVSDDEKRRGNKLHIEQSLFGTFAVVRRVTIDGKCDSGESSAEVSGCVP